MKPEITLAHEFVEFIPEDVQEGTLYISKTYGTAAHKCCCGCGREVVTPLSPTGWRLTFDGTYFSLYPSIGNWTLPCQSHYFITKSKVVWAPRWTKAQIARGRAQEAKFTERYFSRAQSSGNETPESTRPDDTGKQSESLWQKIKKRFS
jgi:hypothetical protein